MARGDRVARGAAADRILNDPIFKEAFETCEKDIVNALAGVTLTGDPNNLALVMEKVHDLQSMRRAKLKLVEYMEYGKAESHRQVKAVNKVTPVKDPRWR